MGHRPSCVPVLQYCNKCKTMLILEECMLHTQPLTRRQRSPRVLSADLRVTNPTPMPDPGAFLKRLSQELLDGVSDTVKKPVGAVRKQFSSDPDGKFAVVAHGTGGVEELATKLDDSLVLWGLLRIAVGSGSMARN
eukprot:7171875-Prymnesium_polylepis.1